MVVGWMMSSLMVGFERIASVESSLIMPGVPVLPGVSHHSHFLTLPVSAGICLKRSVMLLTPRTLLILSSIIIT